MEIRTFEDKLADRAAQTHVDYLNRFFKNPYLLFSREVIVESERERWNNYRLQIRGTLTEEKGFTNAGGNKKKSIQILTQKQVATIWSQHSEYHSSRAIWDGKKDVPYLYMESMTGSWLNKDSYTEVFRMRDAFGDEVIFDRVCIKEDDSVRADGGALYLSVAPRQIHLAMKLMEGDNEVFADPW